MKESTMIFLKNFLSNPDILIEVLNNKIIELLGINSNNEAVNNFVKESVSNFNFSYYEKTYLESLKSVVDEHLGIIDSQIISSEFVSFDVLLEQMEKFKNANYTIEYDLISLANSLSRVFKLKMTRDDLFMHLKKREPYIIDFIKKYNEKIINILKTSIEMENEENQIQDTKIKEEEKQNPTVKPTKVLSKTEMQREMIIKKQEQINKKQERIQNQQEKLNQDVYKLNNRIDKLNFKLEKQELTEPTTVDYKRLDIEIMKTNNLDRLIDIRSQIKSLIDTDDIKDVMLKTSLKEDLNLVVNKIVKVAVSDTKATLVKQLPEDQNGIVKLIFLDKYYAILTEYKNTDNEDFKYFIDYGLMIIETAWDNEFNRVEQPIEKYSVLNSYLADINKFKPYISSEKYNRLINLVEELKNYVSNANQKIIQPTSYETNNQ